MNELRIDDKLTGREVIISENRAIRPHDFKQDYEVKWIKSLEECVFCPGNEDKTPKELYRIQGPDGNWQARVVWNLYKALAIEDQPGLIDMDIALQGQACGAHEVIIDSPNHTDTFYNASQKIIENLFIAGKARIIDLKQDPRFHYLSIFKNFIAGASIEHTHGQLVCTADVPKRIRIEETNAEAYKLLKGTDIFSRMIERSREEETLIEENDFFISLCPYASIKPYEIWIVPKVHTAHFEEISSEVSSLAQIVQRSLRRIEKAFGRMLPYNLPLQNGSLNSNSAYRWYIDIIFPTLSTTAGFELETDRYINSVLPKDAAKTLREQVIV